MAEEVKLRITIDDAALDEASRRVEERLGGAGTPGGGTAGGGGGGGAPPRTGAPAGPTAPGGAADPGEQERRDRTARNRELGAAALVTGQLLATGAAPIGTLMQQEQNARFFGQTAQTVAQFGAAGLAAGGPIGGAVGVGLGAALSAMNVWNQLDSVDAKKKAAVNDFMPSGEAALNIRLIDAQQRGEIAGVEEARRQFKKRFVEVDAARATQEYFAAEAGAGFSREDLDPQEVRTVFRAFQEARRREFGVRAGVAKIVGDFNQAERDGKGN